MGLNKALVDEARRVYEEEDAPEPVFSGGEWSESWEEGEPDATQRRGPWFKVRLTINQPTEAARTYRNRVPVLEGDAELL
ncbi:MAG TPA: hypothetical protein VK631_10515, partial [Solirubrobacteraceae bacterium]|nr:hypothetical protein [Solirubrobacteraceae bacterium]